jgi:Uma2 family endonuclease
MLLIEDPRFQAQIKRYTYGEFQHLLDADYLEDSHHLELINGIPVKKMGKNELDSFCCRRLLQALVKLLEGQALVQCQDLIRIPPNSQPEPDFAIVRPKEDGYLSGYPHPADIYLVIEIADSSLQYDRTVKLELYAQGGIPNYWIVNLQDKCLEHYSHPYENPTGSFGYTHKHILFAHEIVGIPGLSVEGLELGEIFPTV